MAEDDSVKEVMVGLLEDYNKVKSLIDQSKSDPEAQPFLSKYAAKKVLEKMLEKLTQFIEKGSLEPSFAKIVYSYIALLIGTIDNETEDHSSAEKHLVSCLDHQKDVDISEQNILCVIEASNRLGILWSDRGKTEVAKEYLERAQNLYEEYKSKIKSPLVDLDDLLNAETDDSKDLPEKLEIMYTHALFYLGQVYQVLQDQEKSASYFQATLRKQIEMKELDPVDWAMNAGTLSQFYVSKDMFPEARHHLACASAMLKRHEENLMALGDAAGLGEKLEALVSPKADVGRFWVKYCINLLMCSKDRLVSAEKDALVDDLGKKLSLKQSQTSKSKYGDMIPKEILDATFVENEIAANLVLDFEEARPIFLYGQKHIAIAEKYYTKDDRASEYVEIVQDHSKLYQLLAFFEPKPDRQCKMLKRRADMIEAILSELNQRYYLEICRQLQYEMAEIYADMRDIKMSMIDDGEREMSAPNVKKINCLTQNSIKYFDLFFNSFRKGDDKELPEEFPPDIVRPVLLSRFSSARLFSKLMTSSKSEQVENLREGTSRYQFIVDYCAKNNDAAELMKPELSVCSEMASLVPLKINQILAGP